MSKPHIDAEWLIEQVADALVFADTAGYIQRWNGAATVLFGFSAVAALGQSLNIIIPEHLRAAHWAGYNKAIKTGQLKLAGRPTLTRAQHADGHKIYVEMTFALVKDTAGQAIGSIAMARDVSERVKKERQSVT